MGLDNFFYKKCQPGVTAPMPIFKKYPKLTGGIFSGADGSFRGGLYNDLIQGITGVSLYTEDLSPTDVIFISKSLNSFVKNKTNAAIQKELKKRGLGEYSPRDVRDFVIIFKAYSELGYGLAGWW